MKAIYGMFGLLIYYVLGLVTLNMADVIFPCISREVYEKQWKPVVGLFYSFWLRREYGYIKGCVFDYELKVFVKYLPGSIESFRFVNGRPESVDFGEYCELVWAIEKEKQK